MSKYIVRRILNLIPVLVGVSLIVFMMVHISPGDPVRIMLGEDASPEEVERLREVYGLDQPLHIQYGRWVGNVVQGDLGTSIRRGRPVTGLILGRLGATMELAVVSLLLATLISIPLGGIAAIKQDSWVDFFSMVLALLGVSMPPFWIGLMLLIYIALHVDFFPLFGRGLAMGEAIQYLFAEGSFAGFYESIRYLILPAISLGTAGAAVLTRLTRSSMLDVLREDYIRTARSKGLRERVVVFKHAFRNALLPVVTIWGLQLGFLMGGAVITETVFAWPGVGRLIVDAINQRDFPIVQAGTLMLAVVFSVVNLLVDLSYAYLDPRIRYD